MQTVSLFFLALVPFVGILFLFFFSFSFRETEQTKIMVQLKTAPHTTILRRQTPTQNRSQHLSMAAAPSSSHPLSLSPTYCSHGNTDAVACDGNENDARVRHQIDVFWIYTTLRSLSKEVETWKIIHQKFMHKVWTLVFAYRRRHTTVSFSLSWLAPPSTSCADNAAHNTVMLL